MSVSLCSLPHSLALSVSLAHSLSFSFIHTLTHAHKHSLPSLCFSVFLFSCLSVKNHLSPSLFRFLPCMWLNLSFLFLLSHSLCVHSVSSLVFLSLSSLFLYLFYLSVSLPPLPPPVSSVSFSLSLALPSLRLNTFTFSLILSLIPSLCPLFLALSSERRRL